MEPNPISEQFKVAEYLLNGLFSNGNPLSLIFSGPPGFGKSYCLRDLCKRFGHRWQPVRPSAKGLVEYLSEHGRKAAPLIFDDFDNAFTDSALIQTFKIVLDSHDVRVLSNQVRGGNYIAPFRVTSPAVFLTNKDLTNSSHFPSRVWASDVPALKDRSTIISLPFDEAAMLEYTIELAPVVLEAVKERDPVTGFDRFLTKAQKAELVAHLREFSARYYEISPRTLSRLGKLRLGTADDQIWQAVRNAQLKPVLTTGT